MDPGDCLIDAFGPVPVARPGSAAEVGELVRAAAADGRAIYPLGGRTMLGVGLPPERPGVGIDLRGLARVIDYPARDMTITVEVGIMLAELRRLLAAEHQRLPVDVPMEDRATLGGALAVNASGPRRYGCGTFRDYVIGITTVNDEGQPTRAGGRVVKNVAGYDLCKLHVGALGTLGVITQVTLKLRPLPETQAVVTLGCDAAGLGTLLDRVHASRTRPVAVEALNAAAARAVTAEFGVPLPASPWVVAVGFEDSAASVAWQVQQFVKETAPLGPRGVEARAGEAAAPLWQALVELTVRPAALLSFKANLLPSAVAEFCLRAAELPGALVQAHAGSGIVRGHLAGDLTADRAAEMLEGLHETAARAKGNVVVPHCPPDWKRLLPVWGRPRGDWPLMRRVKERLDPRRLFNPGRFVDGI